VTSEKDILAEVKGWGFLAGGQAFEVVDHWKKPRTAGRALSEWVWLTVPREEVPPLETNLHEDPVAERDRP
jgi:hypothetical protein